MRIALCQRTPIVITCVKSRRIYGFLKYIGKTANPNTVWHPVNRSVDLSKFSHSYRYPKNQDCATYLKIKTNKPC